MEETIEYPRMGGKYTHYKGGKYEVMTMATDTETGEAMVVYKSLLFGSIFVRPLKIWSEKVTLKDGTVKPRFSGWV